ncbi:MAG: hypothetical protein IJ328_07055 [Muribaculaceae bacterium]|nr:hypothetical protein [Muribaculaceae bacterium]
MKTRIFITAIFLSIISLFPSCTRNNGDIGELFGLWQVTSVTIDDNEHPEYDGVLYFAFQSSVFSQRLVNEVTHVDDYTFASWKYQGEDIIIDFSDPDYLPFGFTGMQQGQNLIHISEIKDGNMTMHFIDNEGTEYRYRLKKW